MSSSAESYIGFDICLPIERIKHKFNCHPLVSLISAITALNLEGMIFSFIPIIF